uniref:Uncharacterized protein n=1 Tax=Vespula pensylvanica TaxID=30213 RepID=A0A834K335_VESPE|nr:hypothetical protein H0235_016329 [Vespula pensylvanica]
MNVRSVIGWDRPIVIYCLPMPVVLQPTMRKYLGGLSSEGKVKRRVLLSFVEISRLGSRIPKHEGSCGKAEEVLSMSTLEIFGHEEVSEKISLGEDLSCRENSTIMKKEDSVTSRPRGVQSEFGIRRPFLDAQRILTDNNGLCLSSKRTQPKRT